MNSTDGGGGCRWIAGKSRGRGFLGRKGVGEESGSTNVEPVIHKGIPRGPKGREPMHSQSESVTKPWASCSELSSLSCTAGTVKRFLSDRIWFLYSSQL